MTDDIGRQLHDRATRGESLSAQEQALLENWYAEQDQAESAELNRVVSGKTVMALQGQVDAALAQLDTIARQLQEIAAQNQSIRRENSALRRQLAERVALQPA